MTVIYGNGLPVIYGNGHFRPEQRDRHPDPVPSEWIWGVARLDYRRAPNDVPLHHRCRQFADD
jgi:hypothetical protein